jgi:hypothetical protein
MRLIPTGGGEGSSNSFYKEVFANPSFLDVFIQYVVE